MPIYEYHCRQCDADFERLVRSPRDKVKCPKCGAGGAARRPSLFAVSSSGIDAGRQGKGASCASCRATSCAGCRK